MPLDMKDINWASLTHAYGTAEDVPGLLRGLESPDGDVRSAAMYELYGNIFHQGSRYEASSYAVPFLLELAANPLTPARHEVVQLLSYLAVGYAHKFADTGFPVAEMRGAVAQVDQETWQRWSREMKDWYAAVSTGRRQPAPLTKPERRLLEMRYELATYDAVRAGIRVLQGLLVEPDVKLVSEAIHALAWFPEEAASIRPKLLRLAADDERPVEIVATALVAIGLLGGALTPPVEELLERHLNSAVTDTRWSAAVAWAHLAGGEMPEAAIAELRGWSLFVGQRAAPTVWGDRADVALRILDHVAGSVANEVRTDLVAAKLAEKPRSNWHNHFNVVLARAFPRMESNHGKEFNELTTAQQSVVIWLIGNPQVFGVSGPDVPLRQYGLPETLEGLRTYAGLDQ